MIKLTHLESALNLRERLIRLRKVLNSGQSGELEISATGSSVKCLVRSTLLKPALETELANVEKELQKLGVDVDI